jgi:hypothetical protein
LLARYRDWFGVRFEFLLYDVTSTYFEGLAEKSGWQEARPGLEVKLASTPEGTEQFILCRSTDRAAKERAMLDRQLERLRSELTKIHTSLRRAPAPVGTGRIALAGHSAAREGDQRDPGAAAGGGATGGSARATVGATGVGPAASAEKHPLKNAIPCKPSLALSGLTNLG